MDVVKVPAVAREPYMGKRDRIQKNMTGDMMGSGLEKCPWPCQ